MVFLGQYLSLLPSGSSRYWLVRGESEEIQDHLGPSRIFSHVLGIEHETGQPAGGCRWCPAAQTVCPGSESLAGSLCALQLCSTPLGDQPES